MKARMFVIAGIGIVVGVYVAAYMIPHFFESRTAFALGVATAAGASWITVSRYLPKIGLGTKGACKVLMIIGATLVILFVPGVFEGDVITFSLTSLGGALFLYGTLQRQEAKHPEEFTKV